MLKQAMRMGYNYLGKYVHKYRQHLQPLADRLKIARMPYAVEEYVAGAIFFTVIAFVAVLIPSFVAFIILYKHSILYSLSLSFVAALLISVLVGAAVVGYPNFVAGMRKDEINARLAFAVTHMATLAGTGVPSIVIFKALAGFKEYSAISRECAFIVRDVEVFGKDLYTAIMDAARYSPSKLWSEILWSIVSTLRSGGDLRSYLSEKAHQLVELHEREEKKAIETLNIVTEIFMVVFVLAPVVGVVMIAVMGMLGGTVFGTDARLSLTFLIYFILPIIGTVFLIVGRICKPKEVL